MSARTRDGEWLFLVRPQFTTVSPDRRSVYSFDREGRPFSWYEAGRTYKRSLGSEVHLRERERGRRAHRRLSADEARHRLGRVLERIRDAPRARIDGDLRRRLDEIDRWTAEGLAEEAARFAVAYRPIGILPPDQYLAVVLQATLGCSWNRCTFCGFYQDRPFATRDLESFAHHVAAVQALLGRAAGLRRWIFLADGNALVLSTARLAPLIEVAVRRFPGRSISGFVDVYGGERKPLADWRALRALGLRRVHVGIETGHDPLLEWMRKPGSAADALEFVRALKSAGLQVAAILMCGAGGARFADAHVADTLALSAELPLGAQDIVYLSPFIEDPTSDYAARARGEGIRALDDREQDAQYVRLRDGIRQRLPARVSRYDLREFVY